MSTVLEVKDLRISFRSEGDWSCVVHGSSFEVASGETVAIVGESGSGKSVTALSIMRLLDERMTRIEGTIRVCGRDVLAAKESELEQMRGDQVAMIFQEPMTSLNPVLSVGFQLVEALLLHRKLSRKEAREQAIALLDKVRIPNASQRINEYPHQFSGGMRQRVMIAMALACSPKLLIADEPTTALDVTVQAEILSLLHDLQQEGKLAVLFITHDMGVVAQIADRVLVMSEGSIVEQGATTEIFRRSRHPYTRSLIAAVPRLGSIGESVVPVRFPVVEMTTGQAVPSHQMHNTIMEDAPAVLEVNGLTKRFDIPAGLLGKVRARVHAVENVSFQVKHGETLAIVGESGCGKSTTGRLIMRLLEPTSGTVRVAGLPVSELSGAPLRDARCEMQMVFQDPFASLNPRHTVGTAIAEPLKANGKTDGMPERVAGLLRRVGLDPSMARRFPHEFSGGQRQRICIARALALNPKLIIADEAVAALDVSVKGRVINLLMDLQEEFGISFLFISHDMAVVERISHRVAVMYLGEIVEIGPRREVFCTPRHPYTQRLLSAVPSPDPEDRSRFRLHGEVRELKTPIKPADFTPPVRKYEEVGPGHLVQIDGA